MIVWSNTTPTWVNEFEKESLPLGNGKTSALLCGSIGTEHIWLNRYDRWTGRREDALPDVSDVFHEMREKVEKRMFDDARDLLSNALVRGGYRCDLSDLGVPEKPIEIPVRFAVTAPHKHYHRGIDTATGEAFVSYDAGGVHYERRAFVSRKHDAFVMRMCAEKPFSCEITLPAGISAAVRDTSPENTRRKDDKIILTDVTRFLLTASFADLPDGSYDELFAAHLAEYRKASGNADCTFFCEENRSNEALLEEAAQEGISPELCEKLWHFGRYLFISGTAEDANPFPLYGLWSSKENPIFAQHVANENVQSIYWHTSVGGLSSYVKALIHYYYKMIPAAREAARKLFGCRGIFISVYSTPINSLPAPVCPVIINYISAAGWLCRHFYDYYLYTRDEELLAREILPFLTETAAFYEDYVFEDGDGKLVISPSVSPENTPENLLPQRIRDDRSIEGHFNVVVRNSTMDFAILKDLLNSLLSLAEDHDIPREKTAVWKEMLRKIPPYRINEDGAAAEWMDEELEDNYYHRHLSHLYPLFPGTEIGKDDPLLPAFRQSIALRQLGSMCGWSFAHMASIYARLSDGERALENIENLARYTLLKNLLTLGSDWRDNGGTTQGCGDGACIQLDASQGAVNGIQEMLFYASPREIGFLPACPKLLSRGRVRNWHFPGGTVTFSWDREKHSFCAEIDPNLDCDYKISFPDWTGIASGKFSLEQGKFLRFSAAG